MKKNNLRSSKSTNSYSENRGEAAGLEMAYLNMGLPADKENQRATDLMTVLLGLFNNFEERVME